MSSTRLRCAGWMLVVLGCAGCATQRSGPPGPLELPGGVQLERCSAEAIRRAHRVFPEREPVPDCGLGNEFCLRTADLLHDCAGTLQRETSPPNDVRFLLGMTSDHEGAITELCFIESSLDHTPMTLGCLVDKARHAGVRILPDLHEAPWQIGFKFD